MDYAMCRSKICRLSETCRRHPDSGTKPDPDYQCWLIEEEPSRNGCELYWHVNQAVISSDDDDTDDCRSIEPHESGDGHIMRKAINDE